MRLLGPGLILLLLVAVPIAVVWLGLRFIRTSAASKSADALVSVMAFGGLILLVLAVGLFSTWLFFAYEQVPIVEAVDAAKVAENGGEEKGSKVPQPSLDALWEELQRPQIDLDTPSLQAPEDAAAVDTATVVVEARPQWIDEPPKRVGNVYRRVVVSERHSDVDFCHRDLEHRLNEVVRERIREFAREHPYNSPDTVPPLEELGLGLDFILREICRREFIETSEHSFGEMKRVHVLLEFDADVDRQLQRASTQHERMRRFETLVSLSALVIGAVVLGFSLLKFDTWTRGYYTGRLIFGTGAAIISFLVLMSYWH